MPQKHESNLSKMESFGDSTLPIEKEWPTRDYLRQIPIDKRVKLNRIGFKKYGNDNALTGLQLEFTNGVKTDMLETDFSIKNCKLDHVDVDDTKTIRTVRVFVPKHSSKHLNKLQMLDDRGSKIVDVTWYTGDDQNGEWITKEIPEGREIIGFYCNTSKDGTFILRLGFILWYPPQFN